MMRRLVVVMCLAPLAAISAQRDTAVRTMPLSAVRVVPRNSPLVAPWRPGVVVTTGLSVTARGRRYTVPLTGRVGTWRIDSVRTLATAERADSVYLLADVSGRSSATPDGSGYCGAGTEGDLVWVKLLHGRVLERRTAPWQSCLHTINGGGDDAYSMNADSLWFTALAFPGARTVAIHYDVHDPARGLLALVDTSRADSLPRYPRLIASANIEGEVTVRVEPLTGAYRHDTVMVRKSSHPLFAEAVVSAVSTWNMPSAAGTTDGTRTVHVSFDFRNSAECHHVIGPIPPWAPLPGERATLTSSAKGEMELHVSACAIRTRHTSVMY